MFKKLKEKITEEVKISPQRFAEFTQSVSDRLQPSTTSDENFFSIGDDDANTSAGAESVNNHGFSSVTLVSPSQETRYRKNSTSSIASDVSFLPRYEAGNMYHLQSDLDVSASELEDNVSTNSSTIGHLSKEQIYSAFQKSQMRYHKYRGRFTDLTRHYRDLERENAKMKSVLVETQDKAIRRVTELKEQCTLEQKAKAHLESALRDELDEKNYKIKALQTKIDLMGHESVSNSLVEIDSPENNSENLENLTKYLNDARKEIENLNAKLQETKANAIIFQSKEQEFKARISSLEKEIAQVSEREKENNLKIAETKMELHNELSSKDTEIANLKRENEVLKQSLDTFETERKTTTSVKLENLQSQNKKLIEKVESLTQKSNNLENELLRVEAYKLEIRDLKEKEALLEKEITVLRTSEEKLQKLLDESTKNLKDLKEKDASLEKEIATLRTSEEKLQQLLDENSKSLEDLREKDALLEKELIELRTSEEKLQQLLNENTETLTKERKKFEDRIASLREDAKKGLLSLEPKIREKWHNEYLQKEEQLRREFDAKIEDLSTTSNSVKQLQLQLFHKDDLSRKMAEDLETCNSELMRKREDYNELEKNHLELIEECTGLRSSIAGLDKDRTDLEAHEEKVSRLEAHIGTLQKELEDLEEKAKQKERENVSLCQQNFDLQQTLLRTNEKLRILEVKDEAIDLDASESKLLELKLHQLEQEQSSLLSEFETERKMFNDLLGDHRDLKRRELEIDDLRQTLEACQEEAKRLKDLLDAELEKNVRINDEKLGFERQVEKLRERIRIFEEKDEAVNLDRTECGILELKLQRVEEDNRRLSESFELERKSFASDLDAIRKDLRAESEENSDEDDLKHKLQDVRRLSEAKEKENVDLSKEILELQRQKNALAEQTRLLEEKLETVEMESTESKLLEVKVQKLEEEKENMLKEIEIERKMFENLLENHKELQEKDALILQLEDTIRNEREKATDLETTLSDSKKGNVRLAEEKLAIERRVAKLEEQIRIYEEREEALELDKTECGILELKLQKMEDEHRQILETFELERLAFKKTGEESVKNSRKAAEMQEENSKLKQLLESSKKDLEKLSVEAKRYQQRNAEADSKITELLERINVLEEEVRASHLSLRESGEKSKADVDRLNAVTSDNLKLKRELEEKDEQVRQLSKNVKSLSEVIEKQTAEFNALLVRTQQLDSVLEKMKADNAGALQKEKERQEELRLQIEQLQQTVEEKTLELKRLEKLYFEEKENCGAKAEEASELSRKLAEASESFETLEREKEAKQSLETRLKEVETDLKDKTKQLKIREQETYILQEERDSLLAEIDSLRTSLSDLSKENGSLKAQLGPKSNANVKLAQLEQENELLKAAATKSCEEMSQLNVRVQQISSDNRTVAEENQSLMHENEELKIKLEYLESEKGAFDDTKSELEGKIVSLSGGLEETKKQLEIERQKNAQSAKERPSNGPDVARIQRDFFEIKNTCDGLFVENGNLKAEYAKLEEKCSAFGKIKQKLEAQLAELESQYSELQHEKQLLQDEVQELKTSPLNYQTNSSRLDKLQILNTERTIHDNKDDPSEELEILRDKLVKYKSLDLTNKSSIEFYENELQKMKNQNEKLNRKLDETLVTLNHCAELSSSTEVEYLRNVLYNYMLGKESLVLARVIAAVCKFDAQQTETVLQKEQQKQTLLGHLGLI